MSDRLPIPLAELRITFARSSGPGGQNVNKVNTKAYLHWPVAQSPGLPDAVRQRLLAANRRRINARGELVLSSQRTRDAGRNAADCLEKLREIIARAAAAPKRRKATRPSAGSVRRRLDRKRRDSRKKQSRRTVDDG